MRAKISETVGPMIYKKLTEWQLNTLTKNDVTNIINTIVNQIVSDGNNSNTDEARVAEEKKEEPNRHETDTDTTEKTSTQFNQKDKKDPKESTIKVDPSLNNNNKQLYKKSNLNVNFTETDNNPADVKQETLQNTLNKKNNNIQIDIISDTNTKKLHELNTNLNEIKNITYANIESNTSSILPTQQSLLDSRYYDDPKFSYNLLENDVKKKLRGIIY